RVALPRQACLQGPAVRGTLLALLLVLLVLLLHLGLLLTSPLEPAHQRPRRRPDLRALRGVTGDRAAGGTRRGAPGAPPNDRSAPGHRGLGCAARHLARRRVRVVPRLLRRPRLALHRVRLRLLRTLSGRRIGIGLLIAL